jgi:GNAT superfamily N-acetyltransferase
VPESPFARATVRRAVPADAPAMARAHARSWRATYTGLLPDVIIDDVVASEGRRAERWRGWLGDANRPGGCFVAELGGRVVGYVFWGPGEAPETPAAVGEVYAIYLDPDATGRGLGRALFRAATEALRTAGFDRAVVWVLETNARARRFYEAAGWRVDGATKVEQRPGGVLNELRYARTLTRG